MAEAGRLASRRFLGLGLQFLAVTSVTALFFPFEAYLRGLGFGAEATGFIIGADALASLLSQPLASVLIRRETVRHWLTAGSIVFAAALWFEGHSASFALLVGARLLQGAGFSAVLAALVMLVVDAIPPAMSGRAFGWISLARLVPYAAMPPLLDALGVVSAAFARVLEVAALMALLPLLAVVSRASEPAPGATSTPAATLGGTFAAVGRSLGSRPVALTLLAGVLLYGGYAATFFFLRGLAGAQGIADSGVFFTAATTAMIVVRVLGGWLFDHFHKPRLCALGLLVVAVGYALLPFVRESAPFIAMAVAIGLGWGIAMPLQAAIVFDVSAPEARGLNQNLLMTAMQVGFFAGPALSGLLLASAGYVGLFGSAALAALAGAAATLAATPAASIEPG